MSRFNRENLATMIHAVHGSRGIYLGAIGFLIITWLEPVIPADVDRLFLTLPVFLVFATGMVTLSREGVAARQRAIALLDSNAGWQPIARRLIWPALLCVALAPRIFLAGYGIPHMSIFTGVLTLSLQRQVAVTFLFAIMLLPAAYLRSSIRYAPAIKTVRPVHLSHGQGLQRERDILLLMSVAIAVIWAWLLAPFWAPFSLFEWLPTLDSLQLGARGVGSVAFALSIPLVLWMSLNAHVAFLWALARRKDSEQRLKHAFYAALHIILIVGAILLHIYNLLWIAQYRSFAGF